MQLFPHNINRTPLPTKTAMLVGLSAIFLFAACSTFENYEKKPCH